MVTEMNFSVSLRERWGQPVMTHIATSPYLLSMLGNPAYVRKAVGISVRPVKVHREWEGFTSGYREVQIDCFVG
jgi:hypothetical protein